MNALQFALNHLKFTVPRAILEKAFLSTGVAWRQTSQTNVDEQILNNVIRARVMLDCNLIGGVQAVIPLEGLAQERPSDGTTVIHVPKARTQGRSINSVLSVGFLSPGVASSWAGGNAMAATGGYAFSENTALMAATQGALSAFDKIPMVSTARVQLIAENTVLVKDSFVLPPTAYLRCVLAHDEAMNSLQLRSYKPFAKLVEYAVKAYVYNELVIPLDQGELQGGQALGVIKEVVQGYSEAEQNYTDYLADFFEAILLMNDTASYEKMIRLTLGGNR